jgi:rubrerythrin
MITPAEIEIDITKLYSSIRMCRKSIRGYREAIKTKQNEKAELLVLVANPEIPGAHGARYDVEALKRNAEACDLHVVEYERTIEKEEKAIETYERIIKELEKDKWRLEQTFQSTGQLPQES